jgi:hypothetical protein
VQAPGLLPDGRRMSESLLAPRRRVSPLCCTDSWEARDSKGGTDATTSRMGVCFLLGMYLVHEMGFWVESLKALLVRDGTSPVKGVITKKLEAFAACNPIACTLVSYDRPNT